jgi:hypothetical protein
MNKVQITIGGFTTGSGVASQGGGGDNNPPAPACIGFNTPEEAVQNPYLTLSIGEEPPAITVCPGQYVAYQMNQQEIDSYQLFELSFSGDAPQDMGLQTWVFDDMEYYAATTHEVESNPQPFNVDGEDWVGTPVWAVMQNLSDEDQDLRIVGSMPF